MLKYVAIIDGNHYHPDLEQFYFLHYYMNGYFCNDCLIYRYSKDVEDFLRGSKSIQNTFLLVLGSQNVLNETLLAMTHYHLSNVVIYVPYIDRKGNYLKDLNLEISKSLKKPLEKAGATVYLLREDDVDFSKDSDYLKKRSDLKRRINYIESKKSDIYLSVHLNWYSDYYYGGSEILYSTVNPLNYKLALNLTESLTDAGIKTREVKKTNLFLYNHTNTVGVLMECGFLSNEEERRKLLDDNYIDNLASIIASSLKF